HLRSRTAHGRRPRGMVRWPAARTGASRRHGSAPIDHDGHGPGGSRMTGTLNMEVIVELMALSEAGEPELRVDLIEMYLADSPGKIEAFTRGTSAGDLEAAERAANSLQRSAGN